MRNKYVADVGDYGKYALTRAFVQSGIKVGFNWYLTEEPGKPGQDKTEDLTHDSQPLDKKKATARARKQRREEKTQAQAESELKGIIARENAAFSSLEGERIPVAETFFYSDVLRPEGEPSDREATRSAWFEKSLEALGEADLIFCDPDNGLLTSGKDSKVGGEKYVLQKEVKAYYEAGHDVMFYCQRGRRPDDKWDEYRRVMPDQIPEAKPLVMTCMLGSQCSYVFLLRPERYALYMNICQEFLKNWDRFYKIDEI